MRVLLLSLNWVEYLIEMGNALADRGHCVDLVVKRGRVDETVGDELPALLAPGVTAHLLDDRPAGLRDPRQLLTAARLIRLLRRLRPDVIHMHQASNTYLPLCLRLGGSRPLILTVHDVVAHPGEETSHIRRRGRVRKFLHRRARAIVVHGDWLRRQYLEVHPERAADEVVSIPHGCYTTYRRWADDDVVETPRSMLFFGRIHRYKGLPVLLAAADLARRQVPDLRLIVAGGGRDLERHRADLDARPYCEVVAGYLSNADVAKVFQRASLVVLPYIEGSQSGVVRIAYVFGKPVVVSDVGSLAEAVDDGRTGRVVPPGDAEALAAVLVELFGDERELERMAQAAARMPEGALSWTTAAARTEALYERVAATPSPVARPAEAR